MIQSGWKVVRKHNGEYCSVMFDPTGDRAVYYPYGEWVSFRIPTDDGLTDRMPLAVFDTFDNAKLFAQLYALRNLSLEIFPCDYVAFHRAAEWFAQSPYVLYIPPQGARFAHFVRIR